MHHSEEKCAHFSSECYIVGYGTGAFLGFVNQVNWVSTHWHTHTHTDIYIYIYIYLYIYIHIYMPSLTPLLTSPPSHPSTSSINHPFTHSCSLIVCWGLFFFFTAHRMEEIPNDLSNAIWSTKCTSKTIKPEPMLIQIYATIWRFYATMC